MADEPTPLADWKPPPRPHRKTLDGTFVRIEPLEADRHCDALFAAFNADPEYLAGGSRWTYRFQNGFDTRAELFAYLVSIETKSDAHFGVYIDRASGKAGGLGSLMSIDPEQGTIEVGAIMLGPGMSQSSAGTEALILQIRWAFDLGYRRMEWTCDPINAASMRAAQRLGFSYDLTFRQRYVSKGRNRDMAIFSILDQDWPAIDAQHCMWLAPSNFDQTTGKQKCALSQLTAPCLAAVSPDANWQPTTHTNLLGQPIGPPLPKGWKPPPKPPRQTLAGTFASCVPLTLEHARPLYREFADVDDEHWAWLPYGPFASEAEFTEWIAAATRTADPLFYVVYAHATTIDRGRPVGLVSYMRIFDAHGVLEIGHLSFGPALKRSRAATEALYLLLEWAFRSGYRRVEWKCNAHNGASVRAARRLGFVREGLLRQHRVAKGYNRDTVWLSIVDREWPLVGGALRAWLAADNFEDATGKQRRRLRECRAELEESTCHKRPRDE